MGERLEALLRIIVLIVTGIILGIWKIAAVVVGLVNYFVVLIGGKRIKGMAEFCNMWNYQTYRFIRYLCFISNERPFPFGGLGKCPDKFDSKKKK